MDRLRSWARRLNPAFLVLSCWVWSALTIAAPQSTDEGRILPRWELGFGVGALVQPHYPGADESHSYVAPFPYGSYRTPRYAAGRDGIRGSLIGGERWGLGLSVSGKLPLDAEDNDVRAGMRDLDAQFEIGPNLQISLGEWRAARWGFQLPVRSSFSLASGDYEGVIASPKLVVKKQYGDWRITGSVGLNYANRLYHHRIYSVSAAEATANRPVYTASGGYQSSRFSLSATRRSSRGLLAMFIAYNGFSSAANAASPLLVEKTNFSGGVVVTWLLAKSRQTVRMNPDI